LLDSLLQERMSEVNGEPVVAEVIVDKVEVEAMEVKDEEKKVDGDVKEVAPVEENGAAGEPVIAEVNADKVEEEVIELQVEEKKVDKDVTEVPVEENKADGDVMKEKTVPEKNQNQETAPPAEGPVDPVNTPTVMGIISRVRSDPNLSDKDKIDTLSLLVQKFVEENQGMREDITSLSEQMSKHQEAKKAMKALNEAYKKQIEMVREEGKLRLEEEQSKRQDSMGGYSNSMSELATLLETQSSQNGRLQTDNSVMVDQMSLLIGETEKREVAVQRMQQEFQLQLKLSEHQVAKAQIEKAEVKADMTKERLEVARELSLERERSKNLDETVRLLREQADVYQKQMEELQMGAGKNTKSFKHFKTQIEKLTSQMVQLEKDTAQWREKYEMSSQQVKKMNTATMDKEKELVSLKKKLETMVKLNKTLTTERAALTQKVKQLEGVITQRGCC